MPALFPLLNFVLLLVVLVVLLLRKTAAAQPEDPRLVQLLGADIPGTLARSDARGEALERHLREGLAQLRTDQGEEAGRSREASAASAAALRTEILGNINTLGDTLRGGLRDFRGENAESAERLRLLVESQLASLAQRFSAFDTATLHRHNESREQLHKTLTELGRGQSEHQEKLRGTVEERLNALNHANAAKLEEMRVTVDEKLHATLQTRLTESFGAVTDQLTKVHAGLGEMNTLSTGVNDLNRLFSNVKTRGGFAEVHLEKLLDQVLAPGQYLHDVNVGKGTQEVVEFAVKFPGNGADVLLPIDSKFPREDFDRLETAYESGATGTIEQARKAFAAAIITEGKRICSKYINEPVTTPYAVMFLPTEGLYAEVLRSDGLQAELHQNCRVMVAGPSNLYALLTSFQLGFRMLNLQKKGNEVWQVLGATQTEFGKFGVLMDKMDKQVGTVQNTIRDLGVRTRAINRTLRDVSSHESALGEPAAGFDGVLPMLAAEEEEF